MIHLDSQMSIGESEGAGGKSKSSMSMQLKF